MSVLDGLITVGVLIGLFILAYCRLQNKTIGDLITDIRDAFQGEVYDEIQL